MSDAIQDQDLEGLELDEDVAVFDIGMFDDAQPKYDAQTRHQGLHIKNNPRDPFQRREVIQRKGAVDIRCSIVDVVHGAMSPDSDFWASLLVLQFRFDPQKRTRRIAEATIELVFGAWDPTNDEMPEVEAISFDGNFSLDPSKQTESLTIGSEANLGVSSIVEASGKATWQSTVSRETTDKTTVAGGMLVADNMGPNRIAKWTLLENKSLKSGVPASLRVAVRILRRNEAVFTCMPSISCKADKWTSITEMFGKVPEDEHILLNPKKKSTKKLMSYDEENLGEINLDNLGDIVATTMISSAKDTN